MTVSYDMVKDFIEYVIVGETGWEGLRKDSPETANMAYQKYLDMQQKDENGFEVRM
ncbi:hypothetical protein [Bacilliculturomica massiliensis]|uniref:hypothetical protein n=1 Tax=Bacilliculturomica massiliensis TaxID=1917867 RepID=UPI0013EEF7EC|nr:hypothetical protein [Bacilliculturomica massiliensis]